MKYILFIISVLTLVSCAQIVIPEGGDKDNTPPVFIKSSPQKGSLNIFPQKITLSFNENIQLLNVSENISLTPDINVIPKIKAVKNKIFITLPKDSLKSNTSYTINFGKSIADLNEGNVLKNFNYQFSTGNYIDSNYIGGRVVEIKEHKPIEKSLVTLTKISTNIRYSTTTNDSGIWKILNISPGNYKLLILKDKNANKKPDNAEYYFSRDITIDTTNLQINSKLIYYKSASAGKLKVNKVKYVNDYTLSVKLSQGTDNPKKIQYSISNDLNKKEIPPTSTDSPDSLLLFHPFIEKDTLTLNIQTDTLQKFIINQPKKRKKASQSLTSDQQIIRKEDPIFIKTTIPVKRTNSEKIKINGQASAFDLKIISEYKLSLKHNQSNKLTIIFEKGALIDINDEENKSDTLHIKIAQAEETGNYEFMIKDSLNNYKGPVIVKIYNDLNDYLIKTELNKPNKMKELLPGTYSIEAWQDENNNELWDQGNYFEGRQPEKIILIKNAILIKSNWDTVGVEIYMD